MQTTRFCTITGATTHSVGGALPSIFQNLRSISSPAGGGLPQTTTPVW